LGSALARRLGLPWVAEFRDLWSDNTFDTKRFPLNYLDRAVEKAIVKRAAGLVTVSDLMADVLRERHGKHTRVVYSGFEEGVPSERPTGPADFSRSRSPLEITFTGRFYAPGRMPNWLIDALVALLDEGKLSPSEIRINIWSPNGDLFRRWIAQKYSSRHQHLLSICRIQPMVPHENVHRLLENSDVLLGIGGLDRNGRGIVTSKLFEYLGTGRPILFLAVEGSCIESILRETGAGQVAHSAAECRRAIEDYLEQTRRGQPIECLGREAAKVDSYSCSSQAGRLAEFFNQMPHQDWT